MSTAKKVLLSYWQKTGHRSPPLSCPNGFTSLAWTITWSLAYVAKQLETMENMKQTHIINIYTCQYTHVVYTYTYHIYLCMYMIYCMYIHMHTPAFPSNFFWLQSKQIRNTLYFFTSGSHPWKWVHNPPVGNEELPIFKKLPSCMILLSVWSRKRFMLDSQKKIEKHPHQIPYGPFRLGWITDYLTIFGWFPSWSLKKQANQWTPPPKPLHSPGSKACLQIRCSFQVGEKVHLATKKTHEILVGS